MGERVQHPYPCQSLGCPNGHLSMFLAAPPEWFTNHPQGPLNTPKYCPDCKTWMKAQTDSKPRCKDCGFGIMQRAQAKCMHHKKAGAYEAPRQCYRCRNGLKSTRDLEPRVLPPEKLPTKRDAQSLAVTPYDQLSEYRKAHYGKHIPGHPLSQVDEAVANGKTVSSTSLVGPGASSVELYYAAREIAGRTTDTYQYNHGHTIIKVTIVGDTHVETTVFKPISDGLHEPITSFDEVPIDEVLAKINGKKWW